MDSKDTDSEISEIGEQDLIRAIRRRTMRRSPLVIAGIGDDAAVARTKTQPIIVTTDLLIEDVHFIRDIHPPRLLGRKALSVNLSDVAAMGGIPRFALLSMGAPGSIKKNYIQGFIKGFLETAVAHSVELIGGDTTEASRMTVSVTVIGEQGEKSIVYRSGAKSGDAVYVTGNTGDAAAGLMILHKYPHMQDKDRSNALRPLILKHLDPCPRVKLGQELAAVANAMIDTSDGVATDMGHILEETRIKKGVQLAAEIDITALPLSRAFKKYFGIKKEGSIPEEALRFAIQGGEDYELLFTAPDSEKVRDNLSRLARKYKISITRIGKLKKSGKGGIILDDGKSRKTVLPEAIFEHFSTSVKPPRH